MRTREERNAALLEVPAHLRELTKRHCLNAWNHPSRLKRKEADAHDSTVEMLHHLFGDVLIPLEKLR
eukprot:gene4892-6242_t